MSVFSGDFFSMVFRQSNSTGIGDVSMSSQMLNLYLQFDGKKELSAISAATGFDLETTRNVVQKLLELQLIEQVSGDVKTLDNDVLVFLEKQLALAVGPMAGVLIDDEIADMSESYSAFPASRIPELIDILSRQIPRQEKRIQFQQIMLSKISSR